MTAIMKPKEHSKNTDRYAYALGVFIMNMIVDHDSNILLFDQDVRNIHGSMFAKHAKEMRLKNKSYNSGCVIGMGAYNACVDESKDVTVTISSTIRLIQMKHADLIHRVYKLDDAPFEKLCSRGVQQHTMASVKISNKFLSILDEHYEHYMTLVHVQKINKKAKR